MALPIISIINANTHRILVLFLRYIQPTEQICVEDESKLDETLWHREKYWQALFFTNSHGMNSLANLYSKKRKSYRKK